MRRSAIIAFSIFIVFVIAFYGYVWLIVIDEYRSGRLHFGHDPPVSGYIVPTSDYEVSVVTSSTARGWDSTASVAPSVTARSYRETSGRDNEEQESTAD